MDVRLTLRGNRLVPAFTDYQDRPNGEEHTCPCGKTATKIGGRYHVVARIVRVWMCDECGGDNPLRELPVPASIQAALEEEAKHYDKMNKRYRHNQDPDRGVSVKYFAPTGAGVAVKPPPRAAGFRWETKRRVKALTPDEATENFEQWKRDYPRARRHERVAAMNRFNAMVDWKGLGMTKGSINGRPNE